jgi:hypothetical protein
MATASSRLPVLRSVLTVLTFGLMCAFAGVWLGSAAAAPVTYFDPGWLPFTDRGVDRQGFYWRTAEWADERTPEQLVRQLGAGGSDFFLTATADVGGRWRTWGPCPLPTLEPVAEWSPAVWETMFTCGFGDAEVRSDLTAAQAERRLIEAAPEPLRVRHVAVPHWLPTLVFASMTLWLARPWAWFGRPLPAGHCPRCGYNCRATPGRCPECGWGAKVAA